MEKIDLDNVKSAEPSYGRESSGNVVFDIPAGAYIVRIVKAEEVEGKTYLKLTLDVAEGEYEGFAEKAKAATGNDWSYKVLYANFGTEKMKALFCRMLDVLEESNRGFKASNWKKKQNPKELEGLIFGVVMDEDDYNPEKIKTKPSYFKMYNIDDIDKGNYDKPKLVKKTTTTIDEIPF